MRDDAGEQGHTPRTNKQSWIFNALSALVCLYLLWYAIFEVALDPDRNSYWRTVCGLLAPFIAYLGYTYARDAVRLRKRARRPLGE